LDSIHARQGCLLLLNNRTAFQKAAVVCYEHDEVISVPDGHEDRAAASLVVRTVLVRATRNVRSESRMRRSRPLVALDLGGDMWQWNLNCWDAASAWVVGLGPYRLTTTTSRARRDVAEDFSIGIALPGWSRAGQASPASEERKWC
jgi:hypothetical protein